MLQGGGALGAYQVGVYEALHEAGIEPDWVIGTSIGAINAALIAGNAPESRMARLRDFWARVEQGSEPDPLRLLDRAVQHARPTSTTVTRGIPAFFTPNPLALVGLARAARHRGGRVLHDGAAARDAVRAGRSRALQRAQDPPHGRRGQRAQRRDALFRQPRRRRSAIDHVLASGALPPAFPAVRIDGDPYWDGGIYSNTPIEAVLDDKPRQDSVIFTVNMWNPDGPEPESLWQVMGGTKDIQYASRATSHIARQKQIHHLRHIIRELAKELPAKARNSPKAKELASWGCGTTMHVARLVAPKLDGEDHTKDIDFTPAGIRARWQAGYADTKRMIERAPWTAPVDPMDGVVIHDPVPRGKRATA